MSWNSILGQGRVIGQIRTALRNDRLPHAYLFTGPDGTGKDAVAMELGRVLNCERRSDEACDLCRHCRSASLLQHPDIKLIFPLPVGKNEEAGDPPIEKLSAAEVEIIQEEIRKKAVNPYHDITIPRATVIKVNSIREIRRSASLSASGDGRKVYIISDADAMNDEAANALLKTLEEPHPGSVFILTSAHPDRLLPTIASRCQRIVFDPIPEDLIVTALREREGVTNATAAMSAMLSQGSYAQALRSVNDPLQTRRDEAVGFLREVLSRSKVDLIVHIDKFARKKDRDETVQFLLLLQGWIRDGMNIQMGSADIVNRDNMDPLGKFASHYTNTDFGNVFASVERAVSLISRNVYIPLVLTALAVQLRRAIR
jgi:DNA polymerase-3 subunit delta'